ncbi:non-ribosomal peptide synthetase, partial [Marilutibacter spongiae]
MRAAELIVLLNENGIFPHVVEGRLRTRSESDRIDPAIAALIREHKQALVEFLAEDAPASSGMPPIPRRGGDDVALSFAQERLWFVQALDAGAGDAYHMPAALRLSGRLDARVLKRALDRVVERHASLRTRFEEDAAYRVRARVEGEAVFDLRETDLSSHEAESASRIVDAIAFEDMHAPFDLARGPLVRGRLVKLSDEAHVLLVTQHHIVSDGWSRQVFVREVCALYAAFAEGRPDPLPPLPVDYGDYAHWQRERLGPSGVERDLGYWTRRLAGVPQVHALPLDRPRPPRAAYEGAALEFRLGRGVRDALAAIARAHDASLYMLLQAAFSALLARWGGEDDIVVGTPVSGRVHPDLEPMIGLFVNTLVLRTRVDGDASFLSLLEDTRVGVLEAFDHQDLPFESLVEALHPQRSLAHAPVCQLSFTHQVDAPTDMRMPGLAVSSMDDAYERARFELQVSAVESGEGIRFRWLYATRLFDAGTIASMGTALLRMLESISVDPGQPVARLPLLGQAERDARVNEGRGETPPLQANQAPHEAVAAFAARRPGDIAAVAPGGSVDYARLDALATRIAAAMHAAGVSRGDRIGICMARSVEMLASILAAGKLGAAYVPLDPSLPAARLAWILDDCRPARVLVHAATRDGGERLQATVPCLDVDALDASPCAAPAAVPVEDAAAAYLIYTSGSTGTPKGVSVSHGALRHYLDHAVREYLPGMEAAVVATPFSFDATVTSLLAPLLAGVPVVLLHEGHDETMSGLVERMAAPTPGLFKLTPSHLVALGHLAPAPSTTAHCIVVGGEALARNVVERFRARVLPNAVIVNEYGPTEATVGCTTWTDRGDAPVATASLPIGRPIAHARIHLLDAAGQPVPVGVAGEMHIAGPMLALGYFGRADLDRERFLPDPFDATPGARMYRSGDLARWRADGTLEYLGRCDLQVKVRGFRVELGEVEAVLATLPGVRAAIADARPDADAGLRLAAYLVAAGAGELDMADLRARTARQLPAYMVPSAWVQIAQVPLTPNGKVDRKALPEPGATPRVRADHVAPTRPLEHALAAIWAEVLAVDRVGLEDDFFELGGHSLLATRVVGEIASRLGKRVPMRLLFESSALGAFSEAVDRAETQVAVAIPRGEAGVPAPLSFAQQRFWFVDRLEQGSAQNNILSALRLEGALDLAALQQAYDALLARHDILRTTFEDIDGSARQRVHPMRPEAIVVEGPGSEAIGEADTWIREAVVAERARAFDLAGEWPIRCRLFQAGVDAHVLVLNVHHIASDGWSRGLMVRELVSLYAAALAGEAPDLPPLALQYADFARWQRDAAEGDALAPHLAYWRARLEGVPTTHSLPLDRSRPPQPSFVGARHAQRIGVAGSAGLKAIARRQGASLFMAVHAVLAVLVSRWSGEQDVVLGSPVVDRGHPALADLVGVFINSLVLRTDLSGSPAFAELLERVRASTLEAYEHQAVPFDLLVDELKPERSLNHPPLFQVSLTLHNLEAVELQAPGLRFTPVQAGTATARFDIELHVAEVGDELAVEWLYATDIFDASTIERMAASFDRLVAGIVADPACPVDALALVHGEQAARLRDCSVGAQVPLPDLCAHELFEAHAAADPEALAVECDGESLTYGELNARANRIAHYLVGEGVRPDDLVALCVDRSCEMLAGLLGILKAGAAYLPIDPNYPEERVAAMLEDAAIEHVLAQSSVLHALPVLAERQVLPLDEPLHAAMTGHLPATDIPVRERGLTPRHLAYSIHTSGSTGRPKGVLLEHRGLVNLAAYHRDRLGVGADSRVLAFASIGFDGAAWEWLMALANGASLHVCVEEDRRSVERLADLLAHRRITHAAIPPAVLAHLDADRDYALRVLVVSGEACEQALAWKWARRCRVCNSYGPSEATVAATHAEVRDGVPIDLGHPLPNVEAWVLDDAGGMQPVGVPGEICLGGAGLARGYLGHPGLTSRKFVAHPHRPGERLYRTGDKGAWSGSGTLRFLGRVDDQVKLRGFRIEPGEIEARLRQHAEVEDARVLVREDVPGDRRLVAYLVCVDRGDEAETNEVLLGKILRAHLRATLPDYMTPSAFVVLDAFPVTANGKLDKRRLPAPDYHAQQSHVAPRDATEARLAGIWQQVLGVEQVGVHDNFFEIGGDSILAIQVVSRANQAGMGLSTKQLFDAQSIAELALQVSAPTQVLAPQDASQGEQVLLPIHRLFFSISQAGRDHYNMAVLLTVPEGFDAAALEPITSALYARHDALRLRFDEVAAGEWHGRYATADSQLLADSVVRELLPADAGEAVAFIESRCDAWQDAFDLGVGPLFRLVHFRSPQGRAEDERLLVILHHAVVDGVSWRILLADLEAAYRQFRTSGEVRLAAKTSSYQQWGEALLAHALGDDLLAQRDYWVAQAGASVPPLPTDRPAHGLGRVEDTRKLAIELDEAATRRLLRGNAAYRTRIDELLLAGVYLGMRAWTGAEALRVRLDGHGREALFDALDVSATVGYFTSVHPLVLRSASGRVEDVLKAVKEQVRGIPGHGIGYGLLRYLRQEPSVVAAAEAAGEPELEFNYLGQFDQTLNAGTAFQAAPESVGRKESGERDRAHHLGLSGKVFAGQLSFVLDYCATHYDEATMQALAQHLKAGLQAIGEHCAAVGTGGHTPSDFPLARIDQASLDALQQRYPAMSRLYPATPMQAGLHYESQVEPSTYVVQIWPVLKGALDAHAFREAWTQVVARHDILRTAFVADGGTLHQLVQASVSLEWHEEDLRGIPAEAQRARFDAFRQADRLRGFDLASAPMLRIALFRLDEGSHQLLWTQHHILSDGWSSPLIYRDVMTAYQALADGGLADFGPAPVYEHYIEWLQSRDPAAALGHWRALLADFDSPTPLLIAPAAAEAPRATRECRLQLGVDGTRALQGLAQSTRTTVNTLLQWAWGYVLHRYCGEQDVVFGATVSGRPAEVPGIEEMVGLFINTIPVRIRFEAGDDVESGLQQLQETFRQGNEHAYLSLAEVQRCSAVPGGMPLFDSLLVFENLPADAKIEGASRLTSLEVESAESRQESHYRLTLVAMQDEALQIRACYAADAFADDAVARMLEHLHRVLLGMPAWVERGQLPAWVGPEERALLQAWSGSSQPLPHASVLAAFEARADATPDALALTGEGRQWTFDALDRAANRLAHGLREAGVGADVRVAICAPRSAGFVVAMLAVLKAGAAYVPLEVDAPAARLAQLV